MIIIQAMMTELISLTQHSQSEKKTASDLGRRPVRKRRYHNQGWRGERIRKPRIDDDHKKGKSQHH